MAKKKKPRPGGQGRPKGMRVVFCKKEGCGRRVTGFPRQRIKCKSCGTLNVIPVKKKS